MDIINLRDELSKDSKGMARRSWEWYRRYTMSSQRFLGDNQPHQVRPNRIVPGTMIAFFYDPKTKEKLPYYDTFPMNFPFGADDKHFTCINLHYLHPIQRFILLDKLTKINQNKNYKEKDKITISWQLIKSVATTAQVKHCVKQYLFGHVKSNFIVIPPSEWEHVIALPLERFKKARAETVWRNAR